MSATIPKVTCDHCSADLTTTGNCEDYRLVLSSQPKTPWYVAEGKRTGIVTAMAIPKPISQPMHFCSLGCLWSWAAGAKAQADAKRIEGARWTWRIVDGHAVEPPPDGWPVES